MKLLIENKIFTLLLVFVIISSQIVPSFGTASITISPTSGSVGMTVTSKGNGYGSSGSILTTLGSNAGSISGFNTAIYAEQATGLPTNTGISAVNLNVTDIGNESSTSIVGGTTAGTSGISTWTIVGKAINLPVGSTIYQMGLNLQTGSTGTATLVIYSDSAGKPNNLLFSTNVAANGPAGINEYNIGSFVIPAATLWIGVFIPTSNNGVSLLSDTGTTGCSHSGTTSPYNPFTVCSTSNTIWTSITYKQTNSDVIVKCYTDSSNLPSSLIGESASTAITNTKLFNVPVNCKIPNTGKMWIALETDNPKTSLNVALSGTVEYLTYAYGTGPTSFGVPTGTRSNPFFAQIISGTILNLYFDNKLLTTSPVIITTNNTGGFSGVTFTIPSTTTINPHVINVTDSNGNKATANFNIPIIDPTFSEWLHDMSAQILSGHIVQTYSGGTPITQTLNGTGWASFTANAGQQYNYTLWDNANDFQVYKLINNSTTTGFIDKQPVWEWPFNCINPFTGFQSDFIFQQNDTDGHHITSMTQPVCLNQDEVKYNVTYAANGTSNTSYNGLTRIVEGGASFQPNPTSFNVNGTSIGTISTTGVDILSNAYSIGSGLKTILNEFDIIFQKTGTGAGAGSSGGPSLVGNNATCFAGVYNTQTNQCQFGLVGFNVTAPIITINPTNTSSATINLQCSGAQYLTINNVNLGSNPLGLQIYGLPTTLNCGTQPSSCPSGTTLQNGQCVGNPVCPISSQLSNGVCVGTMSCPAGTTMQNGQCLAPAVCSNGAMPINGQCPSNGNVTIIAPQNPNGTNNCSLNNISSCITNNNNTCSITNPLACFTGTTQTEPATITGTTPSGQIVSAKTIITALQSPELNIVSLIFILLILAAIVGGVIYRHYKGKEKKKKHRSNGKDNSIRKFNENLRKK